MADAQVTLFLQGKDRVTRHLALLEGAIGREAAETIQKLSEDTADLFASHAPGGRGGKLGTRGMRTQLFGGRDSVGFWIESTARDFGYSLLGVSRFGHRGGARRVIRPREDRQPASVRATRKRRGTQALRRAGRGQVALRFREHGTGRIIFRHYVHGYRPPSDWVRDSREAVKPIVREASTRLGRRIVTSTR